MSLPATPSEPMWEPPPPKLERPIEVYKDAIPLGLGGKRVTRFQSREVCRFKGEDGKKCEQLLIVERVFPTGFQWDENNAGGQLQHDFKAERFYKRCPRHGPNATRILEDANKYYRISAQEERRD